MTSSSTIEPTNTNNLNSNLNIDSLPTQELQHIELHYLALYKDYQHNKDKLKQIEEELTNSLYSYEVSKLVIARLLKEKEDLNIKLENMNKNVEINEDEKEFNFCGIDSVSVRLKECGNILTKNRKARKPDKSLVTKFDSKTYSSNSNSSSNNDCSNFTIKNSIIGIDHIKYNSSYSNILLYTSKEIFLTKLVKNTNNNSSSIELISSIKNDNDNTNKSSIINCKLLQINKSNTNNKIFYSKTTSNNTNEILEYSNTEESPSSINNNLVYKLKQKIKEPCFNIEQHPESDYIIGCTKSRWSLHNLIKQVVICENASTTTTANTNTDNLEYLTSSCLHPDGLIYSTGTNLGNLNCWHILDEKVVISLENGSNSIDKLCFSENGYYLACSDKFSIKLWDLRKNTNKPLDLINTDYKVNNIRFDCYGNNLIVVGNKDIRVYNTKNLKDKCSTVIRNDENTIDNETNNLNNTNTNETTNNDTNIFVDSMMIDYNRSVVSCYYDNESNRSEVRINSVY